MRNPSEPGRRSLLAMVAVLNVATRSRQAVHPVGRGPNGIAYLPAP